jgi:hypothetical protein
MTGKLVRRTGPPTLRTVASGIERIKQQPATKVIAGAIAAASALATVYKLLGPIPTIGVLTIGLLIAVRLALRWRGRARELEERLLAELPHQHAFLVEFLRETYKLPSDSTIAKRNVGITVHNYENDFVIRGTDCANHQRISGSNTGNQVVRGLAFALVGGSSLDTSELNSRYSFNGEAQASTSFIIDEERFKVPFSEFSVPLRPGQSFTFEYSDEWKGSMRIQADGFFFPEMFYFPSGIHRLSSRLDFSFRVATIAVLAVDVERAIVSPCATQPQPVAPAQGMTAAYTWFIDSPDAEHVYVLHYRAAESDERR